MLSLMLALIMAEPAIPTSGPSGITNLDWARRPSPEDHARYYPVGGRENGEVTLLCTVLANGKLTSCAVVSESPRGEGFGDAAVKLAVLFKLKRPGPMVDIPEGTTVRVPIHFTASPPATP